jgi:Histidine kinase-, DNA gyrase B-, and HSP90-like ATPase
MLGIENIVVSEPLNESREIFLPPAASDLLESMRALGYSFEAAVADLVDNSLSAQAGNVDIRFSPFDEPYVAILDDGTGMLPATLTAAMRHGSQNPTVPRGERDLGRFGLGLKTASLSQCRRMTVVSLRDGVLSGRCWDLDHIAIRQDWILLQLLHEEIQKLPLVDQLTLQTHGTLVLWQNFDRLGAGEYSIEKALGNRMDLLREHLALVFHRFLAGGPGMSAVAISINNFPLQPVDPFLTRNGATQPLPPQDFPLAGEKVLVQAYILPHISRLSREDLELAGGEDGLRRNQGFYVYRNRRLISWGSWFRLVRQEELSKLARVRVDLSSQLDHLWKLDIKKSSTSPPEALRDGLKQIIGRITEGSRSVFIFRGKKASNHQIVHAWDRTIVRDGVSYKINRDHPLLSILAEKTSEEALSLLEEVLLLLERALPLDAIYLDKASHVQTITDEDAHTVKELESLAIQILDSLGKSTEAGVRFLSALGTIEPFNAQPELAKTIAQRLASD